MERLTENNLPPRPVRSKDGHKGDYGHALIVGGSPGKTGAAVMAALSAMRAGAGLTTCALPGALSSMLSAFPELMGYFGASGSCYTGEDAAGILNFLTPSMVMGIGCGIGREAETGVFIKKVLAGTKHKLVLDADALYALDEESLASLAGRAVMTPHIGEFAHLAGCGREKAINNRVELSLEYAVKYQLCLVVKSAETLITTPEGVQYISDLGSPALSKGGSGDVLTGIITGLLAQGYSVEDAALLGCVMQGEASRKAASLRETYAVSPRDVIDCIGVNSPSLAKGYAEGGG